MMLNLSRVLLAVLLLGTPRGRGDARPLLPHESQQSQEAEESLDLSRGVGQPRSKVEYDDWMAVEQTEDAEERARLAAEFLKNYPDSGLTALAHRALANAAYQKNDVDNFILHGEKALLELPESPELLAPMAYLYSERRQAPRAIKYADAALALLEQTERPEGMGSLEWVTQRQGLRADAHYALGRAHLEMWQQSVGAPKELEQAAEHLEQTLELDPEHGYAAYRLGFAQLRSRNTEAALAAYARACVVEGPASGPTRQHLERIHSGLTKDPNSKWGQMSIEEILEQERKLLATKQEEQGLKLARQAAEVDRLEKERLEQKSLGQQNSEQGEDSDGIEKAGLPESNEAMAGRLKALARVDPKTLFYRNDKMVELMEKQLASGSSSGDLRFYQQYAVQLLRAGNPGKALAVTDRIIKALQGTPAYSEKNRRALARLGGIAGLRLGEQQNCIDNHTIESCLLPIAGEGVHKRQSGARMAVRIYTELLQRYPDDLNSRWLLNIAYMAIGEYPDSVPPQWLISPQVFDSDYELPRFRDIAPQVGLAHTGLSGGAALEDFNQDGLLDVVASSWGLEDQLRYFENQGDGTFHDRTKEAELIGQVGGLNLNHADYDNDGYPDLLVLRGGWLAQQGEHPNSLLRNRGDGTFEDVTEKAGLLSFHPAQTAAWGDYDNDGWLDLFVGNESRRLQRPCELYHNNGDGTFTNVAAEVGLDHIGFVKGATWGDYDNDNLVDLYLSCFGQKNLLFHNEGPGENGLWRFQEAAEMAGVTEPRKSFPTWFFDYDNDGFLDIMVGSFSDFGGDALDSVVAHYLHLPSDATTSRLFRNRGDGSFEDVTAKTGSGRVLLAMGANFGDIDNDGWLDAYFGTGEPAMTSLVPNRMLRNAGGKAFQDVTTSGGFGHLQKGHGIAFGDIDNDGDQDIFAVMGGAYSGDVYQNVLFENPGRGNRWITLRLTGVQTNRSAIGVRVRVLVRTEQGTIREIHRTVGTGGSFGSSSLQLEIGLGNAVGIDRVEVSWPGSGKSTVYRQLPLDSFVALREDEETPAALKVPKIPRAKGTAGASASSNDHQTHRTGKR